MTTDEMLTDKEYVIRRVLYIHFSVQRICEKYRIELDDLMQVGRIALWKASENFRPKENGTSFDTYAHQLIKFRIIDYITYLNRHKRQLDYSLSLHAEIAEGVEWLDAIQSEVNVEGDVIEQLYMDSATSKLSSQEKIIFKHRLIGYSYVDIKKKLAVKDKRFLDIRSRMMKKVKKVHENAI